MTKKIDKQKQTIAELKEKIRDLEYVYKRSQDDVQLLKNQTQELKNIKNYLEAVMNETIRCLRKENERLLEIVRWQVNPETTKHPFTSYKDPNQVISGSSEFKRD